MTAPSASDPVLALRSALSGIEQRLASGSLPGEGLEDLKSAIDDVRLRLWGVLTAANRDEYQLFRERFRIRRATEICHGLLADLRTSAVGSSHRELGELRDAAQALVTQILRGTRPPV